jgi:Protein of unknown function (DUF3667)
MADKPAKIVMGETAITAIERTPGRRWFARSKDWHRSLTHCENCGAQLTGHYCGHCGQAAVDYRRSFRHVIADVLESFLNWDSKFFATIALLILKPWRLTNEFLAGKRVRYVNPLRLYLLASILFFFAVNYWAKAIHVTPNRFSAEERTALEAELKKRDIPPEVRAEVENALKRASLPVSEQAAQPPQAGPNPRGTSTPLVDFSTGKKPSTPFEKWVETRAKQKIGEHGINLVLFVKTLISNLPYMMLCCIPLFAFVLEILYLRRHIFYIDHLIYALHIHTFAYVGIMLIVLATIGLNRVIPGPFEGWIIALLWIGFVAQIFLSIRRVYRQGWFVSIFKFLFGGLVYLIVLAVALAATFFITLAVPG